MRRRNISMSTTRKRKYPLEIVNSLTKHGLGCFLNKPFALETLLWPTKSTQANASCSKTWISNDPVVFTRELSNLYLTKCFCTLTTLLGQRLGEHPRVGEGVGEWDGRRTASEGGLLPYIYWCLHNDLLSNWTISNNLIIHSCRQKGIHFEGTTVHDGEDKQMKRLCWVEMRQCWHKIPHVKCLILWIVLYADMEKYNVSTTE